MDIVLAKIVNTEFHLCGVSTGEEKKNKIMKWVHLLREIFDKNKQKVQSISKG